VLHIIEKEALVLVAVRPAVFFPLAGAVLDAMSEVTRVRGPILPLVVAEPVWFSAVVISCVSVSIGKAFRTLCMLETVLPLSFVSVSVLPLVDTVSMGFTAFPLADIGVAAGPLPNSKAVLDSLLPLAIVLLAIRPSKDAFAVGFVV